MKAKTATLSKAGRPRVFEDKPVQVYLSEEAWRMLGDRKAAHKQRTPEMIYINARAAIQRADNLHGTERQDPLECHVFKPGRKTIWVSPACKALISPAAKKYGMTDYGFLSAAVVAYMWSLHRGDMGAVTAQLAALDAENERKI